MGIKDGKKMKTGKEKVTICHKSGPKGENQKTSNCQHGNGWK